MITSEGANWISFIMAVDGLGFEYNADETTKMTTTTTKTTTIMMMMKMMMMITVI